MRYGTWKCWLWGHKFTEQVWKDGTPHISKGYVMSDEKVWHTAQTAFCTRCGIDRVKENKEI